VRCVSCGKLVKTKKSLKNSDTNEFLHVLCSNCKKKTVMEIKHCFLCGSELMKDSDRGNELWCPQCIAKRATISAI